MKSEVYPSGTIITRKRRRETSLEAGRSMGTRHKHGIVGRANDEIRRPRLVLVRQLRIPHDDRHLPRSEDVRIHQPLLKVTSSTEEETERRGHQGDRATC